MIDDERLPGHDGVRRDSEGRAGGRRNTSAEDSAERHGQARSIVRSLLPTRGARAAAVAYAVVSLVFLVLATPFGLVQVLAEWASMSEAQAASTVLRVLQSAMMPLLALVVLLVTVPSPGTGGRRSRLVVLVLVGLGLSWLGDTLPGIVGSGAGFGVMLGSFLVAQVVYIVAFRQFAAESVARRIPVALVYVVVGVGIVAACIPTVLQDLPGSWWLIPALVVYCGAIVTMAILSWGVDRITGIGGVLFVISDGLIALTAFTPLPEWLPGLDAWSDVLIMSTYVVAQALVAAGVLHRTLRDSGGQIS